MKLFGVLGLVGVPVSPTNMKDTLYVSSATLVRRSFSNDHLQQAIFEVGSFNCFFRSSYFERLLVVTLAPFAVVALTAGPYWLFERYRGKFRNEADRREVTSRISFCVMIFIYFILPSISTFVLTYFSCSRFADDGTRRGLVVVTSELTIKCTNRRYRTWRVYAGIMIGIWPVGVPLVFATLLWANRAKLNPALDNNKDDSIEVKKTLTLNLRH